MAGEPRTAQTIVDAVEDWVTRQQNTPWAESWSQDFRNGYDAALEEVDAIVAYQEAVEAEAAAPASSAGLDDGPDLVFSTSPAPEGIDTDCFFLASAGRVSVHISRRAINAQVVRAALATSTEEPRA
jgi:hypothetical protein